MKRAKRLKIKGIYLLYRVLQAFGLPLLLLYFLLRGLRNRAYWGRSPSASGFCRAPIDGLVREPYGCTRFR